MTAGLQNRFDGNLLLLPVSSAGAAIGLCLLAMAPVQVINFVADEPPLLAGDQLTHLGKRLSIF
jgi:hypothetical protein